MKKLLYLQFIITPMFFIGCMQPNLTPKQSMVRTISDTTNCQFIDTVYFESSTFTMSQYAKINTTKKGGNAYKILSTNTQVIGGTTVMMTNIEVYKCKF